MPLYLDNAATSHPKPASVYEAVRRALEDVGASSGRAAHRLARQASALVSDARKKAAEILGIPDPLQVIFTKNATESINVVLKGWLRPGDRVLISGMEHNAVVRPLRKLAASGVKTEVIPTGPDGELNLDALGRMLRGHPRLVALSHASNVNGTLQPVSEIAGLCDEAGVPLLLDAAQTAGLQHIAPVDWNLGMLACSGHKGLLGPQGTGVLYVRKDLDVSPLLEGGTGSRSEEDVQPEFCPDRFESGTLNLPGIAGLAAGIDFILEKGMANLRAHELKLASTLEEGLSEMQRIRVFRPKTRGTGVVSFAVETMSPGDVAHLLDEAFDIAVRAGLHCAPLAHRTIGSFPQGTVRVSPGFSSTHEDMSRFLEAMGTLVGRRLRSRSGRG
ncbi:MAG: aminotransferase class V-fold PLP-dependent enzyme [Syntrophobacteraceae bacterium]|nr:aminotransferase class V-fold PLP-dependent enzyme [Syntrophobacteraceae bacterium]